MSEAELDKISKIISGVTVVAWDGQPDGWVGFKKGLFLSLDAAPRNLRAHFSDDLFHVPDVPAVADGVNVNAADFNTVLAKNIQKQKSLKKFLHSCLPPSLRDAVLALSGRWTEAQATGWVAAQPHGRDLIRVIMAEPTVHTWWNYLTERFDAQTQFRSLC